MQVGPTIVPFFSLFPGYNMTEKFVDALINAGCAPYNTADIVDTGGESRLIRAQDDKTGRKSLYYSFDGKFGNWYSCKTGENGYWFEKASKDLSKEEKAALKEERERRQKELEQAQIRLQSEMAVKLESEWDFYGDLGDSDYLLRKKIENFGGRFEQKKLVLKMVDRDWKIWGLQDIYPDGAKYFRKGARKKGCFIPIGIDVTSTPERVFFTEGYATGASVHMAMAEPVIACLDVGNLQSVAVSLRGKWPDAQFIFCADNDKYTKEGADRADNPGIDHAKQAAVKVGARVIWPEFDQDDKRNTDFNDLHVMSGLGAVCIRIQEALTTPEKQEEIHEFEEEYIDVEEPKYVVDETDIIGSDIAGDLGLPIRVLGYDNDQELYYYYSFIKHKMIVLAASQHNMSNLYGFCDFDVWKKWANGGSGTNMSKGQVADLAEDNLKKIANKRGFFVPDEKLRGSGTWLDGDRVIMHCGEYAYVDGVKTELHRIKSKYVYVVSGPMPKLSDNPLKSSEAVQLREICESLVWDNKLSGSLLAGWLVVATICPALSDWRPHIWITGESGAGKTTVLNQIVKRVLSGIAMCYEGGTTEPAIRQSMKFDGRPIIYDEAEPKPSMEGVLALARSASSSQQNITKFGQRSFKAQFCACFSSINPPIKDFADETRISVMFLRKNRKVNAREEYDTLLNKINCTLTPEFAQRLLARTAFNMKTLLKNIQTFKKAAGAVLKDSRSADQISPMLAGLYLLNSTKLVTEEEAELWIRDKDWTSHTTVGADPDHVRCLRHIMTYIVRLQIGQRGTDMSIGDVVSVIYKNEDPSGYFDSFLRMYGMRVIRKGMLKNNPNLPDGVCFVNKNQHISKILKGTDWSVNYAETLKKFDNGVPIKSMRFTASTGTQGAIFIPMAEFWGEE